MVSKSYSVSECPRTADKSEECADNAKANSDQIKTIDRFILHISSEMVSRARTKEMAKEEACAVCSE